jgi:RNA polymerase sigma factor (sigma-70 family)
MGFDLDPDRLTALYRQEGEAMLVYFARRCYDGQLAVDLVAETFARAFEKRRTFRGADGEGVEAWVWAIARNALSDALRRGRAEQAAVQRLGVVSPRLDDDELLRVEQVAGLPELRATLARALLDLAPEQREALRLKVVLELDYAAVAARLGVSQQVARARVSRGLRALRTALDSAEARP